MKTSRVFALFSITCCLFAAAYGGDMQKKKSKTMDIDNSLTAEEKAAGIMTPEVMWKLSRVDGAALSPDGRTVMYAVTDYSMPDNKGFTSIWSVSSEGGTTVQVTGGDNGRGEKGRSSESGVQWNGDGSRIYFLSDRSGSDQIWSATPAGDDMRQVSEIEGGVENFALSPAGEKLLYVKRIKVLDRSSSEIAPDLPESKARIYDDLMVRHWNRWDDGTYLHIFVAGLRGGKLVHDTDIMEGEPWDAPMAPYFDASEIAWNNAGTQIAYTCKKMIGTEYALSTDSDIYIYDIAAKTTANITAGMPGYDRYPVFSPDGSMLAFCSMERAGNESDKERLMVVELESGEKRYLTKNFDYNASNVKWDGNGRLWFISPIEATIQVCTVDAAGREQVKTVTSGLHDINKIDLRNGVLVAERVSISSPADIFSIDKSTGEMARLTNSNKGIFDHIKMGQVQKRWVKTTDGKDMLTWVILPPGFDPSKKYPALLYCQGGPQSVVSQFWSYRWNFQLMAAQGYIVVAPNRRGLPSFGQEWLDQISGDYSGQNIRDYLSAIDDVAKEPWVDSGRLGCVGASYGGYSVFFLEGRHEKRFKAFIAHCGMFNMESMYGATEELWFPNNDLGGPYWSDNPVAKRSYANSPHKFVQNWDTPLLILVGADDYRIPYTESLQAFTAARLRGLPSRLVVFEDEGHWINKPQNSILWNREFFGWLDKYLKN